MATTLVVENRAVVHSVETTHLKTGGELFLHEVAPAEKNAVDKTTRAWKNLAMDRLGNIRQNKPLFEEDREFVEQYKDLIRMYDMFPFDQSNKRIKVLKDEGNTVQGICTFTQSDQSIYINQIFTAPWNLKMHADNDPEYTALVTRGVGTILLASCYKEAQKAHLPLLELKPLDGSLTYYTDVIGMKENSSEKTLFFTVDPKKLPTKLEGQLSKI